MIIHRFFCPGLQPGTGTAVQLPEAEGRHAVKVLRLRPGDEVLLLDGAGTVATATLSEASRDGRQVSCLISQSQYFPQPEQKIHLYVAPPRGKTFDLVLKMATELGVWQITPVICRYGVAKPSESSENWENILQTAVKQSVNPWLPAIAEPTAFSAALSGASLPGYYGAVPRDDQPPRPFPSGSTPVLAVWIGPEGGFSEEETQALYEKGYCPLTIGQWTLRVETAVAALLGYVAGHHSAKISEHA